MAQLRSCGLVTAACCVVAGAASSSYASSVRYLGTDERTAHIIFHIDVGHITESSSLVDSTAHPGLIYTANDSGDGPYIYVLDRSGALVGTTTLAGVRAVDFEAMSGGSNGSLVVGDVGDNDEDRASVQLYKIAQPRAGNHTVRPDKVTLTYEGGPRNAESVLYNARSGRAFVVSKEFGGGHVYSTPRHVFASSSATLQPVSAVLPYATDAAWLPEYNAVVVRSYKHATVYGYPSWRAKAEFALPTQRQGESISAVAGRASVWVGSEGQNSAVWSVPLPRLPIVDGGSDPTASPSTSPANTPPASTPPDRAGHDDLVGLDGQGEGPSAGAVALAGGTVVALVVGAAVVVRASRRGRARSDTPIDGP